MNLITRLIERSKEWWLTRIAEEPDVPIGAGKPPEMVTLDLRTGRQTLVRETDQGKLWAVIATNHCPDCNHEGFWEGPHGGMSINITCANDDCKARFNVTPVIGIAERI